MVSFLCSGVFHWCSGVFRSFVTFPRCSAVQPKPAVPCSAVPCPGVPGFIVCLFKVIVYVKYEFKFFLVLTFVTGR